MQRKRDLPVFRDDEAVFCHENNLAVLGEARLPLSDEAAEFLLETVARMSLRTDKVQPVYP